MLPAAHRLTAPADFREVVRRGRRHGRPTLVVHLRVPVGGTSRPVTAGFVVSKAVGTAVDRNRVKRRLRHLVAARLPLLPPGAQVVVRALPPSSSATSEALGHDLDRCFARLLDLPEPSPDHADQAVASRLGEAS